MNQRERRDRALRAVATILLLAERYPKAFHAFDPRRQPLKIGIDVDIKDIAALDLDAALMRYTHSLGYLAAMVEGAPRIDLAGNPVGTVSAEEAQDAKTKFDVKWAKEKQKRDARRKAKRQAKRAAQWEASRQTRLGTH